MIPWRMSFSGIRDYRAEQIDLSGKDHHIMITGPNGSGKSTITYCMGAVLYSSKVEVEGLKSRNLLPDQTWKAQISLVFKNDGLMKIDAAPFIQLTLRMVQDPGQPIKKEYSISSGEEIDKWDHTTKYTSGDRQFNFSAYKKDLLYKYKIDPDAYYLIWYQQEVNQFAVMNPEERFRIFSEMHGIDQTQREWEESIGKLKETTETLGTAKYSVDNKKLELQIKKADFDRFTHNQERLNNGAKQYIESLLHLEVSLKTEIKSLEGSIEELTFNIEETQEVILAKQTEKEQLGDQILSLKSIKEKLEAQYQAEQTLLERIKIEIKEKKKSFDELESELEELTKRKKQISRTEEQVKTELTAIMVKIGETEGKLAGLQENISQIEETSKDLNRANTKLELQIEKDTKSHEEYSKILKEYHSSHIVSNSIETLEKDASLLKNEQSELDAYVQGLKQELNLLQENRDLSQRQTESLNYLKARNMKAYPLRELIELDEYAQLKDERLFNAIKYTVFFQGKYVEPPNDLYHVPLMDTVPDRSIESFPELHLRIKDGVKEEDIPHAIKALWWVGQFFKNGPFRIQNGSLQDSMGIRGPQEKDRYILSKKALLARKQEVKALITKSEMKLLGLKDTIAKKTRRAQELNRIIQFVREAEAFMATDYERKSRIKQFNEGTRRLAVLDSELEELKKVGNDLNFIKIQLGITKQALEEEAAFYQELGKMKGKYDQLVKLERELVDMKKHHDLKEKFLDGLEEELDKLEDKLKMFNRNADQIAEDIETSKRGVKLQTNQLSGKKETLDSTVQQLVAYMKEITDVQNLVPDIYRDVQDLPQPEQLLSISSLKQHRENGKITFDQARSEPGIDPAAPENFEAVKQEFERLDNEYKRTNILLEQDKERAEQLKDKLETTINMRVTEIRKRFQSYMSHFQFEGDVDWMPSEDKRGRTNFKLFIKARKEGHRGTMEDVSTKARGGRVGKGVSGGEESLSSLLFALALLQNLSYKPGFIVLDEFDSALDENRKLKVFDLYVKELKRKLIILTPKSHEEHYLKRFSKALVVQHDPTVPSSKIVGIIKKE